MEAFRNARPITGDLSTTLQAGNGSAQVLTDDDLRTERAPVKEPAKRWLNWWRMLVPRLQPDPHGRGTPARGLVYPGVQLHPSRDVAETIAAKLLADDIGKHGYALDENLGAYPEGERP